MSSGTAKKGASSRSSPYLLGAAGLAALELYRICCCLAGVSLNLSSPLILSFW